MTPSLLLIDGTLRAASDGRMFPDLDPSFGEEFAQAPDASARDAEDAVLAARQAFDQTPWRADPALRSECLHALLAALEADRETIRDLLVQEGGVPVRLTHSVHLDGALTELAWICALLDRYQWQAALPAQIFHGFTSQRTVRDEPVGVAALLTPGNFPAALLLRSLFLALGAGNTVVLKPSPHTPLIALLVAGYSVQIGFPPGVLNVLTSADPVEIGRLLAGHELVDLVGLTGSTPTGRDVARTAATSFKRTVLNLGGNGAHILLDDADPEAAAVSGARVCFHAGQACSLFKRLLLPRNLYRDGLDLARQAMAAVPIGDSRDPATVMGPVVSSLLRDRVLGLRRQVEHAGGRMVYGGGTPPGTSGYYVQPALIADLPAEAPLARHELPGPALLVLPYDSEEQAVALANHPPYGLSAAVTSASEQRALAVAARLRTGAVTVNDGLPYGPDSPCTALGHSGNGHSGGAAALQDYLVRKVVGYPGRPTTAAPSPEQR